MACGATALSVRAADLNLEARLIWGANDDNNTVNYKPADPELSGKLHRMFKWKNYYEITNDRAGLAVNQSCDLGMCKSCAIHVRNMGGSRVEINCIGHDKQAHKGAYTLEPGQWLIVGGNNTNNTAWFLGLRAIDDQAAAKAISKN
jgi:hypothetical protein